LGNNQTRIIIAKETASDDYVIVYEINYSNGEYVESGEKVGSVETSKAVFEIHAPTSGYIYYYVSLLDEIPIGSTFAVISKEKETTPTSLPKLYNNKNIDNSILLSKKANVLIKKYNLDIALFGNDKLVKEADVQEYLTQKNSSKLINLDFSESDIVIYGGGGHGRMCLDILKLENTYNVVGYIDDDPRMILAEDVLYLGTKNILIKLYEKKLRNIVLGIGFLKNMNKRSNVFDEIISHGYYIPNIIHTKAIIEPSVKFGDGNQICAGSIIGSNAVLRNNCIINSGAIISHDCIINDNVHITPGAILGGGVEVGENSIIGMGASILMGVKIGKNVTINNGVSISRNIIDGSVIK